MKIGSILKSIFAHIFTASPKAEETVVDKLELDPNTIDIYSKGQTPAAELSNFYAHEFTMDGVTCHSMEGFLQSLKYRSARRQRKICLLVGKEAKKAGDRRKRWKKKQKLYWQGETYERQSEEFSRLIARAYGELYRQNENFREILNSTKGKKLAHTMGKKDKRETVLTEREFIDCLYLVRDQVKNS